ncbi:MAG TPA: hypothetical protein VHU90_07155 [Galbitalea sp.]|nr:hypothetical protein [Galbitalea sp.]
MSWDVHLQKFDQGREVQFDLQAAQKTLQRTRGFREAEPGIGELVEGGYAEIYYGSEPSCDMMVSVRAASSTVFQLIYDLAAELRMVVFFPTEKSWSAAVVEPSQSDDLPDRSWEGWERFDDGFTPPTPIVCSTADDLAAALVAAYGSWETWAHGGEKPH